MEKNDLTQYNAIVRKSKLVSGYRKSIARCLIAAKNKNARLWSFERERGCEITFKAPEVDTRLGKDLVSLTALRPELLRDLLQNKRVRIDPKTVQEIGTDVLRRNSLVGTIVSLDSALQERLHGAFSLLGSQPFEDFLYDVALQRWSSGMTVEGTDSALQRLKLVLSACRKGTLSELVESSWNKKSPLYNARCWPLYVGVAVIKALVDKNFGFLNAQRRALGDTHLTYKWDLLNRYARGETNCLELRDLLKVIQVFQEIIGTLGSVDPSEILHNEDYLAQLSLYRVKEESPLMLFVERTLSTSCIEYYGWPDQGPTTTCPFASKAKVGSSSGRTSWHFGMKDGRLLHVLSSYSSTHKDKEYCAKARLSRYRWDGQRFEKSRIGAVAVILDGKWKSSETSMFSSAGVCWFPSDNPQSWISWLKGNSTVCATKANAQTT